MLNRPGGGENPQLWGWLNENRPDQVWRAAEPPQRSKTVGLDLVGRDNTVPNNLELIVMDSALLGLLAFFRYIPTSKPMSKTLEINWSFPVSMIEAFTVVNYGVVIYLQDVHLYRAGLDTLYAFI